MTAYTGLNTYHLRSQDSQYVIDIDLNRKAVSFFGDRKLAMMWLIEPEKIEAWVAEVQALVPSIKILAERAR